MFDSILSSADITLMTCLVGSITALIFGAIGGAIGGIIIGGKDLGNDLAALMGSMFGPVSAVPGVFIALIILYL